MSKNEPLENAEEIIERFGGIRPMASKTDVPVTTIQGWKKRNVIPANRRTEIVKAAQSHSVDLSGLVEQGEIANENAGPMAQDMQDKDTKNSDQQDMNQGMNSDNLEEEVLKQAEQLIHELEAEQGPVNVDFAKLIKDAEERAVTKSTIITFFLLAVVIGAFAIVLWPSSDNLSEEQRLAVLEGNMRALEDQVAESQAQQSGGILSAIIPEDIDARIASLQDQATRAQEGVNAALEKAQEISGDVLSEGAGDLEVRLNKLEAHVSELAGSPVMAGLLQRYQGLQATDTGGLQLDQSVSQLGALLSGLQTTGPEEVNAALDSARTENPALGQTFDGVPTQQLQAAALLLGMTQFRSSLNRDGQPFEDDLALLMNLVGDDNPDLTESLQRLAPKAEEGVLTPSGLTNEFKTLTGEIVVASLKGEEISMQEKAQAKFNELLQIEKDGELVTGTQTQVTLAKTESLLEAGNIAGAIELLKGLDGSAASQVQPWIEQAQATLVAQQLSQFLTNNINLRAFGRSSIAGMTAGSGAYSNSELIRDEATGINILKRNKGPSIDGFKGLELPGQ